MVVPRLISKDCSCLLNLLKQLRISPQNSYKNDISKAYMFLKIIPLARNE